MNAVVSNRRALLAGAAAVTGGGTLTSGMAAGIAAAVEPSPVEPDAQLIRICDEIVFIEHAWFEIYDGKHAIVDDAAAKEASAPLNARMEVLLDEMESIRAVSAAGVLARAQALAVHNGDFGSSFDWQETTTGRMLSYLMRDAAALAGRA